MFICQCLDVQMFPRLDQLFYGGNIYMFPSLPIIVSLFFFHPPLPIPISLSLFHPALLPFKSGEKKIVQTLYAASEREC